MTGQGQERLQKADLCAVGRKMSDKSVNELAHQLSVLPFSKQAL